MELQGREKMSLDFDNDQASIHFTRLLIFVRSVKIERHFLAEKAEKKISCSGKSSPENIARFLSQKSVLRPALLKETDNLSFCVKRGARSSKRLTVEDCINQLDRLTIE